LNPSANKILTHTEVLEWRSGRESIVFSNGVFDLLHPGHISVLEGAKACGEALVVALNDDASAVRLGKGPGRPISPLFDRQQVVAALGCVDCVTSFAEDTPAHIISLLRPDVIVKGGDYRGRSIPGQDLVASWGGRVVTIDYSEGHSTTRNIRRIRGTI
jgi:rfaE bifunctional protein nucleotidyltransferase chain/domain